MMQSTIGSKPTLHGDWRRRFGTKTDAHLYVVADRHGFPALPRCKRNIPRRGTIVVVQGRPCTDCLIAAIRAEAGR